MFIHAFLRFLHNYTNLFLSGVNFSNRRHISPGTVTIWLLYIFVFTSTYLVTSHNLFNLILTIPLLYFVVRLQIVYIYSKDGYFN